MQRMVASFACSFFEHFSLRSRVSVAFVRKCGLLARTHFDFVEAAVMRLFHFYIE